MSAETDAGAKRGVGERDSARHLDDTSERAKAVADLYGPFWEYAAGQFTLKQTQGIPRNDIPEHMRCTRRVDASGVPTSCSLHRERCGLSLHISRITWHLGVHLPAKRET